MPDSETDPANVPTVTCSRCEDSWTLEHELDDLGLGNEALAAFAIDHHEHTGHFPDDVRPWLAVCRNCREAVERLEESAARRWAHTHARHTSHAVAVDHDSREEPAIVERS
ncbi:hypothetical protein [Halosegnis sp.]|uniref:hypothetical protein n=1 Tax=Halosegnis sp. TaxID=2864959 RepID=UPI0035D484AD